MVISTGVPLYTATQASGVVGYDNEMPGGVEYISFTDRTSSLIVVQPGEAVLIDVYGLNPNELSASHRIQTMKVLLTSGSLPQGNGCYCVAKGKQAGDYASKVMCGWDMYGCVSTIQFNLPGTYRLLLGDAIEPADIVVTRTIIVGEAAKTPPYFKGL